MVMLESFFNGVFGWAINLGHLWGLIIIAFILTLLVTLAYKFLTDQSLAKSIKEEMKQIRQDMKEFKDDPEKVMELQKTSMEKSMKQMKMSLKPIIITLIPLIIIFGWLRATYADIDLNFLGFIDGWIWVYIIVSIIFSLILRRFLRVH
jgi:uncharacterized membrane protein (DUF106 family)